MDVDFSSGQFDNDRISRSAVPRLSEDQGDPDEEMDDDDSLLEFKASSRRNSTASLQDYRTFGANEPPHRPQFRRSSTGSSKNDRGAELHYSRSSGRVNKSSSRSRSSGAQDREHVTIAPIAPTILKAGDTDGFENGTLYMGGTAVFELTTSGVRVRDTEARGEHLAGGYPNGNGYGYGGYGFGEEVSAGRVDAYRNFERGTEAGELVYQSPNGNIYPWNERDAIRFVMANEFGMPSPPSSPGLSSASSAHHSFEQAEFVPLQSSTSPRMKDESERAEFEYFDEVDRTAEHSLPSDATNGARSVDQQVSSPIVTSPSLEGTTPSTLSSPPQSAFGSHRIARGDSGSSSGDSDERSPSPEVAMKQNPRIASIKTDSFNRQPSSSLPHSDYSSCNTSGTSPIPILRPSLASGTEVDSQSRSLESPTLRTGFLSPPDLSPRGRWLSTPPESSSSVTPSYFESGSRSTSESRSDSRGRSQTRNSSLTSSDTNEPERGRSRSRSVASGANSPLREAASPGRCSPIAGSMGVGLGIGGSYGGHVGREVRDGRGMKLYRKTSEDNLGDHYDGRASYSLRGRVRDGKRVSESLSPPIAGSLPADINRRYKTSSPPNSVGDHPLSSSPSSKRLGKSCNGNGAEPATPVAFVGGRNGTSDGLLLLNDAPTPAARLPSVAEYGSVLPSHKSQEQTFSSDVSETATPSKSNDLKTSSDGISDARNASNLGSVPQAKTNSLVSSDREAELQTQTSRISSLPSGKFSRNGELKRVLKTI